MTPQNHNRTDKARLRTEHAWARTTAWLRTASEEVYQGSRILPHRIVHTMATWARNGDADPKERWFRVLTPPAVLLLILIIAIRPGSLGVWAATVAINGVILFAAVLAPLLAVFLAATITLSTAPGLMWIAVALWCWRARHAAHDAARPLPYLLADVLTTSRMTVQDTCHALNHWYYPACPWTPKKLRAGLEEWDIPVHTRTTEKDGTEKRLKEIKKVDVDDVVETLEEPDENDDEQPPHNPPRESPPHPHETPDETTPEEPPIDPLLSTCARLIGNRKGVHLSTLTRHLNQAAPNRNITTSQVRSALTSLGVVVKGSVRAPRGGDPNAGNSPSEGVHRADLEAVIGPLPHSDHQGLGDHPSHAVATGPDLRKQPL